MERVSNKMKLKEGMAEEYKRRHDELWPELQGLLKASGISDYAIFLDEETHILFATLKVENKAALDKLPAEAVMQRWWKYMSDIMDTNPDNSPVSIPLKEVFYLP
ncbi:L-rhamnose mutarotase [Chitinophaga horti]|uniref:L-rhamnose mutarotase n=1 Tax=Chitinophaga horti TaxID=2920382 RepID=A0ABY6JAG0_9BACT|nr:L-rhamnose mutarotase [Chitinophaga horti]UYQ95327.1 L-rhamnose mutarotase [Chitinophaga horti]